jgi:hypothetical protein
VEVVEDAAELTFDESDNLASFDAGGREQTVAVSSNRDDGYYGNV